jgi:hypothetical protein
MLYAVSTKQQLFVINFLLLRLVYGPFMVGMLFVKVVRLFWRNKRSLHLFSQKLLPVEVFEPRMLHNLVSTVEAESFAGLPL